MKRPRWNGTIRRTILLSALAAASCLGAEPAPDRSAAAAATTREGPIDPTTGAPKPLNPGRAWADMVIAAKALEEGDADLAGASKEYATIVSIFEQLRTVAAEALHRQALVEARRHNENDSKLAWTRLAQWFPDFEDKAAEAAQALGSAPAKQSEVAGSGDVAGGSGTPLGFSGLAPELMRRYGLGPGGGGAPEAGAAGDPGLTMSPELRTRYGLVAPGSRHEAPPPDKRATERTILTQRRADLLAESSKTASEMRRAERELNRVGSLPPREIPPSLVSDERLRRLIEESSEPLPQPLSNEQADQFKVSRQQRLRTYHSEVYLPRLKRTVEVLRAELEEMRRELAEIDVSIRELGPAL